MPGFIPHRRPSPSAMSSVWPHCCPLTRSWRPRDRRRAIRRLLQCLVLTMPPVDALERLIDLLADHGAELTDPLIAASGIGNVRAIAKLLDLGARIEGNGRWSPLEEALYWANKASVSLLLERGAAVVNLRTAAALERHGLDRSLLRRDRSVDGSSR